MYPLDILSLKFTLLLRPCWASSPPLNALPVHLLRQVSLSPLIHWFGVLREVFGSRVCLLETLGTLVSDSWGSWRQAWNGMIFQGNCGGTQTQNTCSKIQGCVFSEVAEAPQAARTQTHPAGRPWNRQKWWHSSRHVRHLFQHLRLFNMSKLKSWKPGNSFRVSKQTDTGQIKNQKT